MHTLIWLAAGLFAAGCAAAAQGLPAPEPRTGIFATRADVEAARRRAETLPWARERRERILKVADEWAARDDAWIRGIMPPPHSRFAYGVSGCPACGKSWKNFGANVCRLDRPLVLECPACHKVFDLQHPEPGFEDTGDGVKVNGQTYWLRGVWNGFVVDSIWSAFNPDACAVNNLGDAYALTGDPKYAHALAVITDALATLAPQTNGPRDFDRDVNRDMGRLQHLTSIVFRADVHLARALDLCGNAPAFSAPSPTFPGRTVWENVRNGLFEDYLFVPFNTRNGSLAGLHNHEADSVRGLLVTGILFGEPDYVRWAARSAVAFLDNTIDRDGLYYETSLSYTAFTRSVFVSMAHALMGYDPSRYPGVAMPARADLPMGGNLFNHPRLARLALDSPARLDIAGRQPTYGNNHWDAEAWLKPGRPFVASEFEEAEGFLLNATDPTVVARAREAVAAGAAASRASSHSAWAFFHEPAPLPEGALAAETYGSDLFGNTSLVFLRAGEGADRRGLVMRSGPNMPHAHNDQGALMLFALGRALSGDIGYGIFGNHVHLGWATQPIAHNTVVVNQSTTGDRSLFRAGPGGSVERFHDGPGVSWAETSLANVFPEADGVREYRRLVMQLDLSSKASYWVDLFDIDGGRVHDYSFHARPTGPDGSFDLSVPAVPVKGAWTLAGLDPANRDASYNAPGRAWGERLTVGGLIRKIPVVIDEVPEAAWWYAPPGNGYGFLYDVKAARTDAPWRADWRFADKGGRYALRMFVEPEGEQQVITATGPNLTGSETMRWVVVRHGDPAGKQPVQTRFAAVMAAGAPEPPVEAVSAIRAGGRVAGLTVRSAGAEDTILDSRRGSAPGLTAGLGVVRRRGGQVHTLVLSGGPHLAADGFVLDMLAPRYSGRIASVDDAKGTFRLDPPLPTEAAGTLLVVRNALYARPTAYRVGASDRAGDVTPLLSDLTLARGRVGKATRGGFESTVPLPYANVQETPCRTMDGKRIVYGGQAGHILSVTGFKGVRVSGPPAREGGDFVVYDVQAGDTVEADYTASLTRGSDGVWTLRATGPCRVTFPWPVERESGGSWAPVAGDIASAEGTVRFRRKA